MSASSKKKLRRELNAAAMTEKQLLEQKETKKLRLYTGLFAAAIAVMILVVVIGRVVSSGFIPRNTTALTVGGTKISAAELNHYYIDSVNNFLNQAGDMVSMFGLDSTKALDEQYYNEAEGDTWADYFLDQATASAQNMYAVYNAAKAEGFTLSQEAKDSIDATVENLKLYATMYGFPSADSYIVAMYGDGCNEKTFREYAEVQMIAQEYAVAKNESLTYDEAAIQAENDLNPAAYSAYTYNYCYLNASKFYQGGTKNEDGTTTYSDEEMAAGRAAAEAAANTLAAATTAQELDAAYAALEINAESTSAKSTRMEKTQYANVTTAIRDWVTSADRKAGDIAVIPSEYTNEDGTKSVSGYYVVLFEGMDENLTELVNVRHILVSFEGGKTDETTGVVTYSDEEKAAANTLAAATTAAELDAAYAALEINAESTSAKSTRMEKTQYANVTTAIRDWVTSADRKAGDIAVIPSEYTNEDGTKSVSGYYVVLFEGMDENLTELVNVRHILVSFEGGKTDETTGAVTYSDEEKAAAKAKAEEILAAYEAGEKTEDAFAALATEKTTDPGSQENGGLYENVYPGQMLVNFNDWCFDAARKTGDTGLVETEYGYHVMYFVGNSGMTYRDFMIDSTLRNNDMTAWESELIEAAELVVENTKYVKSDLTLSSNS